MSAIPIPPTPPTERQQVFRWPYGSAPPWYSFHVDPNVVEIIPSNTIMDKESSAAAAATSKAVAAMVYICGGKEDDWSQ